MLGGVSEQGRLLLEEDGERWGSLERRITGEGGITARTRPPEPCLWRETGETNKITDFTTQLSEILDSDWSVASFQVHLQPL